MKNKNVNIYVFSGTGNTLTIANKISDILNNNSYVSKVHRMEAVDSKNINLNSSIAIGFTVACWNTYPFVRKWIDTMPLAKGTEIFLFNSMGDSSLRMISHIAEILKKKGYEVIGSREFIMPNNFLLIENENKKNLKIAKAMAQAESFAKSLALGTSQTVKSNFLSSLFFIITTLIIKTWKFKICQKIIKFKIDKDKCSKCAICLNICPTGNIFMKDFPEFNNNCQFCLRCVSYCPEHAIKSRLLYKNKTHRALSVEEIKWK